MKRKTIARRIRNEPALGKKLLLGLLGEEKPRLEILAMTFLALPDAVKYVNAPVGLRQELFDSVSSELFGEFLNTLVTGDSEALRAVASFLDKKAPTDSDIADIVRVKILNMKATLPAGASPMTYAELAKLIHYAGDMDVFRRLANELQFPVKKQRGGRPRNSGK